MERVFNVTDKKGLRRKLRLEMTKEERKLWKHLSAKKLEGIKFHKQFGIGRYIVDFYCPSKKLVIEIDGSQHYTEEGKEYDKIRAEYMKELGITTLRFSNIEINDNVEKVIEKIKNLIF